MRMDGESSSSQRHRVVIGIGDKVRRDGMDVGFRQ